jgi:hypothetical protein
MAKMKVETMLRLFIVIPMPTVDPPLALQALFQSVSPGVATVNGGQLNPEQAEMISNKLNEMLNSETGITPVQNGDAEVRSCSYASVMCLMLINTALK